jgi:hypothetical protein
MNITVLVFVHCVEVLPHVSIVSGHHQEIITRICHSLLRCLQIWIQTEDL